MMVMLLLILQLWDYLILSSSLKIVKMPQNSLHLTRSGTYYSEMTSKYSTKVGFKRLKMELIPISKSQFKILMPQQVNMKQWRSYWGTNRKERLQRILESVLLAYGGLWLSWFLSFMAGSLIAACVGTALVFNWMFGPYISSRQNNNSLYFYKEKRLSQAVYRGRIVSLKRIRRRAGKTVGAVSQEFVSIMVSDEFDREMEIITPWQDRYSSLRPEMSFDTIIASPRNDFSKVVAITDSFVPACNTWIGDYPYLNRKNFLLFLSRLRKLPRVDSSLLGTIAEGEGNGFFDVYDDNDGNDDDGGGGKGSSDYSSQPNPKPFPARKSEETVPFSSKGMGNRVR